MPRTHEQTEFLETVWKGLAKHGPDRVEALAEKIGVEKPRLTRALYTLREWGRAALTGRAKASRWTALSAASAAPTPGLAKTRSSKPSSGKTRALALAEFVGEPRSDDEELKAKLLAYLERHRKIVALVGQLLPLLGP